MGIGLSKVFSCSDSHEVYSLTRKTHDAGKKESRTHHKAHGNITDSEDIEAEEELKDEMDDFQDL